MDDYSRAVAGYFLSFEDPSALHTSLALRQAIWRKEDSRWSICGIPEVLYTDHGSDFTSRHLEQVGADLKIRLAFSIPVKPRGRGRIERFFSTVNEMFLCELDGYDYQAAVCAESQHSHWPSWTPDSALSYWMCTIVANVRRRKHRRQNGGKGMAFCHKCLSHLNSLICF